MTRARDVALPVGECPVLGTHTGSVNVHDGISGLHSTKPACRTFPSSKIGDITSVQGLEVGLREWHTIQIAAVGHNVTAVFDGERVASVLTGALRQCWAALGSGWHHTQFDSISLL